MRYLMSIIFAALAAVVVVAAPTAEVTLESLNFPDNEFTSMLSTHDSNKLINCPRAENNCGVVTFNSGQYTTFGQGTCMQLGRNVQSIYVAKCYCSLWHSCTGKSGNDIYVGGMMMCEKPRSLDTFEHEPKYISCGGMN
ncbi:hypothetical protein SVAN01_06837 [Stagonosporopsis vannaccii]|nr:hypothetical protein SVAN01_06837 [Stagonosporopsis vannaccii]